MYIYIYIGYYLCVLLLGLSNIWIYMDDINYVTMYIILKNMPVTKLLHT